MCVNSPFDTYQIPTMPFPSYIDFKLPDLEDEGPFIDPRERYEGEVRKVSSSGAEKGSKIERYDLIPAEPLRLLAQHFGRGAMKYADRNWEAGYEWSLSFAALMRHAWAFWGGEDIDPETGTPHVIAAAWHAFALAEYMNTHREFDNRPSTAKTEAEPLGEDS